jgi:excisionase family DNA binding protein
MTLTASEQDEVLRLYAERVGIAEISALLRVPLKHVRAVVAIAPKPEPLPKVVRTPKPKAPTRAERLAAEIKGLGLDLITVTEAAQIIGIHATSVVSATKRGTLPCVRLPGVGRLIERTDADVYRASRVPQPKQATRIVPMRFDPIDTEEL